MAMAFGAEVDVMAMFWMMTSTAFAGTYGAFWQIAKNVDGFAK